MTVIPAAPGFDIAAFNLDPYEFEFIPIVAWVVEVKLRKDDVCRYSSAVATPICADWSINDHNSSSSPSFENLPYRDPSGSIHFNDGPSFKKGEEDKALAHAVERWEELQKSRKRIKAGQTEAARLA